MNVIGATLIPLGHSRQGHETDLERGGDEERDSVTERRGLSSRLKFLAGFPFGKLLKAIENVQGL